MTTLSNNEMQQIQGGSKCGFLWSLTAISCMTGMLVACGVGLSGYGALC